VSGPARSRVRPSAVEKARRASGLREGVIIFGQY
jgi:hypothetical protein